MAKAPAVAVPTQQYSGLSLGGAPIGTPDGVYADPNMSDFPSELAEWIRNGGFETPEYKQQAEGIRPDPGTLTPQPVQPQPVQPQPVQPQPVQPQPVQPPTGQLPGSVAPPTPEGPGAGLGGTQGPPYRDPNQYNYAELAPPDRGTINWQDLTFSGKDDLYGVDDQPGLGGEYLYPGEFSPWGDPSMPGDNSDFYAKQFQRMLSNNLRWQDQNEATNPPGSSGYVPEGSGNVGEEFPGFGQVGGGSENPKGIFNPESTEGWTQEDWEAVIAKNPEAWEEAFKSAGNVPLPAGPGGEGYMMNPQYDSRGKTNAEIVALMSNILSKEEQSLMNKAFKQDPTFANATNWGSASGPEAMQAALLEGNITGKRLELYNKILNNIYSPYDPNTGGVPIGYAPPRS